MSPLAPYRKLIARLSLDAHASPAAYRSKALTIAASCPGYLVVLYGMALLMAVVGALTAGEGFSGKLMFLAGVVLAAFLTRALSAVELPRPDGFLIGPDDAPQLWKTLNKLSAKLQAPRISEIVIDAQMGVRLVEYPRWGCLGDSQFVLQIGLPWLQLMSPKQATAGIAQAMARFGHRTGGINAWFLRSRDFWPRFVEALPDDQGAIDRLLCGFLVRNVPYVQAYTLCLATECVLAADADAAACVGAERTAQAIQRYTVFSRWLDEYFWAELMRHADDEPVPRKTPHRSMAAAFRVASKGVALKRMFQDELARKHMPEHVLPCLSDRLEALDQRANLLGMPEQTAAEYLLGDQFDAVVTALDDEWLQQVSETWRKRHESVQAARMWLASFGEPDASGLSLDTLSAYAAALLTVGDRLRAIPLLRRAAEHPQGTADTAWLAAQALIDQGDAEALHYLDLVMARDTERVPEMAELGLELSERHGKRDKATQYQRALESAVWA